MDNRNFFKKLLGGLLNAPLKMSLAQQELTNQLFQGKKGQVNDQIAAQLLSPKQYQDVVANPVSEGIVKPIGTAASYGASFATPLKTIVGGPLLNSIKSPAARFAAKGATLAGVRGLQGAVSGASASEKGKELSSAGLGALLGIGTGAVEGAVSKAFKPDYIKTFSKGLNLKNTGLYKPTDISGGLMEVADKMKKSTGTAAFDLTDIMNNKDGIAAVMKDEVAAVGKDIALPSFKNKIEGLVQRYMYKPAKDGTTAIFKNSPFYNDFQQALAALPDNPSVDDVHNMTWLLSKLSGGYSKMEKGGAAIAQAADEVRNQIFKDIADFGSSNNNQLIKQALNTFGKSKSLQGVINGLEGVWNSKQALDTAGAGAQALILRKALGGAGNEAELLASKGLGKSGNSLGAILGGVGAGTAGAAMNRGNQNTQESLSQEDPLQSILGGMDTSQGIGADKLSSILGLVGQGPSQQKAQTSDPRKQFIENLLMASSLLPNGTAAEQLAMAKELAAQTAGTSDSKSSYTIGEYAKSGGTLPVKILVQDQNYLSARDGIENAISQLDNGPEGTTGKLTAINTWLNEFMGNPTKATEFKSMYSNALTSVRNALIGAGMTDTELKMLDFPTSSTEPAIAKIKLKGILDSIDRRPLSVK